MFRFKQFENVFLPKKMADRESVRKQLLEQEVEKDAKGYLININTYSNKQILDSVIEDIFFIWDRYNSDDRLGIEYGREGGSDGKWNYVFHYENNRFLEHIELFLKKIKCAYKIPRVGTLVLEGFTS